MSVSCQSRLLALGKNPDEAARPRLLIQMIKGTDAGSFHSKGMTGISRDGTLLYYHNGSGNPSKRGFGGLATDERGAPPRGSSHESYDLTIAPALSLVAQRHLSELDRFYLFLAEDRRLLPTNEETCQPIRQAKEVAEAEAALDASRAAGEVVAAESALKKAQNQAWNNFFMVGSCLFFLRLIWFWHTY